MTPKESLAFMRDLEGRYRKASGLADRAHYKIFYGPVRPAEILVLGINPGGDPANTNSDGATHKSGETAAASDSFYENGECDLLDCNWKENSGLKKLLVPLLDGDEEAIRTRVVKTNLAFRRSPKAKDIDIAAAKQEAEPFLQELIGAVHPRLVILTSVDLAGFLNNFCSSHGEVTAPLKDHAVKQIVFESANAQLRNNPSPSLVVRVAHASQFSWTYSKTYDNQTVLERIRKALSSRGHR